MFYIRYIKGDICGVVDTEDGVLEEYPAQYLLELSKHIEIKGVDRKKGTVLTIEDVANKHRAVQKVSGNIKFKTEGTTLVSYTGVDTVVNIPWFIECIGNNCFRSCDNITSVIIPDTVTSIGHSAFYGCSSLKNITLSKNIDCIGNDCFSGCTCLDISDIGLQHTKVTKLNRIVDYIKSANLDIGNTKIEEIENTAFYSLGLTSFTLPNTLKKIGNFAFTDNKLRGIDLRNTSVRLLGTQSFADNSLLTYVRLPSTLQKISMSCFDSCPRLDLISLRSTPDWANQPSYPNTTLEIILPDNSWKQDKLSLTRLYYYVVMCRFRKVVVRVGINCTYITKELLRDLAHKI